MKKGVLLKNRVSRLSKFCVPAKQFMDLEKENAQGEKPVMNVPSVLCRFV